MSWKSPLSYPKSPRHVTVILALQQLPKMNHRCSRPGPSDRQLELTRAGRPALRLLIRVGATARGVIRGPLCCSGRSDRETPFTTADRSVAPRAEAAHNAPAFSLAVAPGSARNGPTLQKLETAWRRDAGRSTRSTRSTRFSWRDVRLWRRPESLGRTSIAFPCPSRRFSFSSPR